MRPSSIAAGVLAVIIAGVVVQVVRPVPTVAAKGSIATTKTVPGSLPSLPWPKGVEADVAISGLGNLPQHGPSQSLPIGSMAKMMTAYLVLKAHPLSQGMNGPSLTVTAADVALYQHDVTTQQSVMPVVAGEKLSERTLLEGLLVPSGNNVATMLAEWVGGSVPNFTAAMNRTAKKLGLRHTQYHGPVGLDSRTVSTVADQIRLANLLMKNSTFREIVAMPAMTVPGQTNLDYNYNYLVGHQGIIGVKTGSTIAAGGCVVLAKDITLDGTPHIAYAAVIGQQATAQKSQLQASLADANALIQALGPKAVSRATLVTPEERVGTMTVPWASNPVPLVATKGVAVLSWPGTRYHEKLVLRVPKTHAIPKGTVVGSLQVTLGRRTMTVPVKTGRAVTPPSIAYRLVR